MPRWPACILLIICMADIWQAHAAPRRIDAPGFSLVFDDHNWNPLPVSAPVSMVMRCSAPGCSDDASLTITRDNRSLPAPGIRTLGVAPVIVAAHRIQSLTPGSRILIRQMLRPVSIGGTTGYRGTFEIQDKALVKTDAVIVLLRLAGASVELRLTAASLSQVDIAAFDIFLNGFSVQN